MSNLQIIEELSKICEMQNRIIKEQAKALEQLGATVLEDERAEVNERFSRLLD
jgi:hypothetical protein